VHWFAIVGRVITIAIKPIVVVITFAAGRLNFDFTVATNPN